MHKFIQYFLLLTLIISCAVDRPSGTTEAEVLFKEASELLGDKRYILANEKLNTLRSQYPYSYYATSAELLQADILFMQENYEEASAAYILFKDFHPKNQKMDYVMYKIAESYYRQLPPKYDRDLQPAIKAITYYNELRSLFPSSEHLVDANAKIKLCEKMLLDKEKYIADFYYKTNDYVSAKSRYITILNEINDSSLKIHAVERLMNIGIYQKDSALCKNIFTTNSNILKGKSKSKIEKLYTTCLN